ncbi:zinc finger CCCH domain-containing protein 30-like [Phalaenopsis equestris]|uniref:zinc finger CCCH domain-containing protein 30-like n=1 Tax=Phalaenopsis equestris TaxID=78828 RepID=UPI0009E2253A|nr:zinc finger CCCH domain-containing protein 30-like [Phalaenopsis equestris]
MGFPVSGASMASDVVAELLELAASDQLIRFRHVAAREPAAVHIAGHWYGRCPLSSSMTILQRTPLMVAAAFGSLNVLHFIISLSAAMDVDIDFRCGPDAVTALHCVAAGGAPTASLAATLLLIAGADPNALDAVGRRPVELIPTSPILSSLRSSLEAVLSNGSPPVTPSSDSTSSSSSPQEKKKNYPIDSSIPDIQSRIYSSDEFRMFSFKIKPCSRAYSHDWTECPFVHPGENARRRDPRRFNYSCTPCVEFRRGLCPKGDLCEYAHGVFECWLHPAQYRTRLCKDGDSCSRRVCFFAHSTSDLRSLPNSRSMALPHLLVRIPRSNEFATANCASPRFQPDYIPSNLSPMSRNQQHGILTPRTLNYMHCVLSPRSISPNADGAGSVSYLLDSPASESGKLELQFQQQQLMRSVIASNLKQDSENVNQELVEIEPDLSWVQSLVGNNEIGKGVSLGDGKALNSAIDDEQATLGAWLEQMQLDRKIVL